MTLDLFVILVLAGAAFLYAAIVRGSGRGWALMGGSIVAIYWFQPSLPIRFSSFVLQTTTILLTIGIWWLIRSPEKAERQLTIREDRIAVFPGIQ